MSDQESWNALISHPASSAGCEISRWNGSREEFRMWDIRVKCRRRRFRMWDIRVECRWSNSIWIPQEDMWRALLSGFPHGEAHGTRNHHTPDDSISYLDMLSGWKRPMFRRPPMVCPDALSGHLLQGRLKQDSISDSKELSSISDCFGDQKVIKTPKLNTIWLELIVRVFNMLIGLKGDNYYSKVFKRVNYKLWNNTFWVVCDRIKRGYHIISYV